MKHVLCVTLFTFLLAAGGASAENFNIQPVGGVVTDWITGVKVIDDIAYCSTKYGLVLFDVSDKENPVVIRRIESGGIGQELYVRDSLLFYCDGFNGLKIFDITERLNPSEISHFTEAGAAVRIKFRDSLAFVTRGRAGFSVIDIQDTFSPEQISELNCVADDIALYGNYAYTSGQRMGVVNISDIENPEFIRNDESYTDGQLEIYRDHLCSGLLFYSLENPENPEYVFGHPIGGNYYFIEDDVIFLKGGSMENGGRNLACYNIQNPVEPQLIGYGPISFSTHSSVYYYDNYVYLCHPDYGLSISDVSDRENPQEVSYYENRAQFEDVWVQGEYAYTVDHLGRLVIFRVEQDGDLEQVHQIEWPQARGIDRHWIIASNDDYLFMHHYLTYNNDENNPVQRSGMYHYSLAEPSAPEEIGHRSGVAFVFDMVLDGDFLFTSGYNFTIISYENPENPEIIWENEEYSQGLTVDIENNLAVTVMLPGGRNQFQGIVLWDKSDPFNLEKLAELGFNDPVSAAVIYGDYVYVGDGWNHRVWIVSISDPEEPRVIGSVYTPATPYKMKEVDGLLYLAQFYYGVEIFSLEDPEHPERVGYYNTPEDARQVFVRDSLLFVADRSDLSIYDVSLAQGLWYLDLSADSHAFDTVRVGEDALWELTLTNLSEREREVSGLETDSDVFTVDFAEPFPLPSGSDTTFTVTFTPQADSLYEAVLTILSGERQRTVSLSGYGYRPNDVEESGNLVREFRVSAPYPNPFNSSVQIIYSLDKNATIRLTVYDVNGSEITTLAQGEQSAGTHELVWQAKDVPSGIYFCRLQAGGKMKSVKLTLVR